MNPLAYIWILNIVLIIDWAKNRRPTFWLGALIFFGPLGAMAYIIYFYEQINFPIEIAKSIRRWTGKKVVKACPRCGIVSEIKAHQDGRQLHYMCQLCIERTFVAEKSALSVVQAAADIVREAVQVFPEAAQEAEQAREESPETAPTATAQKEPEFDFWGVPAYRLELPDEVEHALEKMLKLEKRYGAEQDVSPSLHKVVVLGGVGEFPKEKTAERLQELFEQSKGLVGGEMVDYDWGRFWNAEHMRKWVTVMDWPKTESWMREHVLREFGERKASDELKESKKSKKARKERDQKLDLFIAFLKERFTEEASLYWVNDCDNENTQEAVYFLVSGNTAVFWVNYWVL